CTAANRFNSKHPHSLSFSPEHIVGKQEVRPANPEITPFRAYRKLQVGITGRKRRQSVSRREEALSSNVSLWSTSPQCQPTTVWKDNNLQRIEQPLRTCHTRFTGRDHRQETQVYKTGQTLAEVSP